MHDPTTGRAALHLPILRSHLERAFEALRQIETLHFHEAYSHPDPERTLSGFDSETDVRRYFEATLRELFTALMIALDHTQLTTTAAALKESWRLFTDSDFTDPTYDHHHQVAYSAPMRLLQDHIDGLAAISTQSEGLAERLRLESILRAIPRILLQEGKSPTNETNLRKSVEKYLEIYYTRYTKKITIPGATMPFAPDAGIADLRLAIEFKFADTKEKAQTTVHGILEDVAAYSGSSDWTYFIALIYQTDAFLLEDRVNDELRRASAKAWKAIVVTKSPNAGASDVDTVGRQPQPDTQRRIEDDAGQEPGPPEPTSR